MNHRSHSSLSASSSSSSPSSLSSSSSLSTPRQSFSVNVKTFKKQRLTVSVDLNGINITSALENPTTATTRRYFGNGSFSNGDNNDHRFNISSSDARESSDATTAARSHPPPPPPRPSFVPSSDDESSTTTDEDENETAINAAAAAAAVSNKFECPVMKHFRLMYERKIFCTICCEKKLGSDVAFAVSDAATKKYGVKRKLFVDSYQCTHFACINCLKSWCQNICMICRSIVSYVRIVRRGERYGMENINLCNLYHAFYFFQLHVSHPTYGHLKLDS